MPETIKRQWLKDANGNKLAPRTYTSQITTDDGVLLEQKMQNDLNEFKSYVDEEIETKLSLQEEENEAIREDIKDLQDTIIKTTDTIMPGSVDSVLLINNISGVSEQKQYTGKNLIPFPHDVRYPYTSAEVTYTYDEETGFITANGTANSTNYDYSVLNLQARTDTVTPFYLSKGKYRFTCCGENASTNTYYVSFGYTTIDDTYGSYGLDQGEGFEFEVTDETRPIQIQIKIRNGYTANNLVFKPMLCKLDIDIPYPYYQTSGDLNGITFTDNEDGSIKVNGTATDNSSFIFSHLIDNSLILGKGKYRISGCPSGGSDITYRLVVGRTSVTGSFETVAKEFGEGVEFTLTKNTDIYIGFEIIKNATVTNLTCKPVLSRLYDEDETFEPYTGNALSPSPNYPQEIKNSVISEIKTTGKNFLDDSKAVNADRNMYLNPEQNIGSYDDLLYLPKGTYTISYFDSGVYTPIDAIYVYIHDKNKVRESSKDISAWSGSVTFTLEEEKYVGYNAYKKDGFNTDYTKRHIMIESGSSRTDFEPYKESVVTLSQPVELRRIEVTAGDDYTYEKDGNYYVADTIENIDGEYKLVQRIYRHKVDKCKNYNAPRIFITLPHFLKMYTVTSSVLSMCNRFTTVKHSGLVTSTDNTCSGQEDVYAFRADSLGLTSVEAWETWFANNETIIDYVLAEPIITSLPIEDQIALNKLSTYNAITYLEFDSEVKPTSEIEYGTNSVGSLAIRAFNKSYINTVAVNESTKEYVDALVNGLINGEG